MDGSPENDLSHKSAASFADKWLVNGLNDVCESPTTEIMSASKEIVDRALEFCSVIKTDRFATCSGKGIDVRAYIDACKMDYVQCVVGNGSNCGCTSIAAYADECLGKDSTTLWRDHKLCRKRFMKLLRPPVGRFVCLFLIIFHFVSLPLCRSLPMSCRESVHAVFAGRTRNVHRCGGDENEKCKRVL